MGQKYLSEKLLKIGLTTGGPWLGRIRIETPLRLRRYGMHMPILSVRALVLLGGCLLPPVASAVPRLDEGILGESLGGWNAKRGEAAEYTITGTKYRTWKPHVTPTADGGLFLSLRIDHVRGLLASDDHASLELSFDTDGAILTARSTIALQGRKITSDVIKGVSGAGTAATTADRMVKMGTDLVADLTAKLLREKVNEPGRVGFPAALQHNYHLLCLAVGEGSRKAVVVDPDEPAGPAGDDPAGERPSPEPAPGEDPAPPTEQPGSVPEPAPAQSPTPGDKPSDTKLPKVPPLKIEEQGRIPPAKP